MNYKEKIDYSSLSCYLECPRKFFFQYMLHLKSNRPSIHLVFGGAWHYGLECSYNHIKTNQESESPVKLTAKELRDISIAGFDAFWALEGLELFDPDIIYPKSPARAYDMYNKYWKDFLLDDTEVKIIGVEEPFLIDLSLFDQETDDDGLPCFVGRLDLVTERPDSTVEIIDHKTASMITKSTSDGFYSSMQTDGYLLAGHIYFDANPTVTYSLAVFQKSKMAFSRLSFSKRKSAIDRYIADLTTHVRAILKDIEAYTEFSKLSESASKHTIMAPFTRKTGYACTLYFSRCPYYDLCNARSNPATFAGTPPQGYEVNEWDPIKHEEKLKEQLKANEGKGQ